MEIKAPPLESLTCVRSTIFAGRYPRMTVTVSTGFTDKADCPYSGIFRGLISSWPGSAGDGNKTLTEAMKKALRKRDKTVT